MLTNAPEFLANLAATLYEEDPIYFDVKRLMPEAVKNYIEAEVRRLWRTLVPIPVRPRVDPGQDGPE